MPGAAFEYYLDAPRLRGPDPEMHASVQKHLCPHRQPPVLPDLQFAKLLRAALWYCHGYGSFLLL